MARSKLTRPIHFAFSYDEEVGCVGAKELVAWLKDQPVRPQACFVGEPSNMQVVIRPQGQAQHDRPGARPHQALVPGAAWGERCGIRGPLLVAEMRRIAEELQAHGARDENSTTCRIRRRMSGIMQGGTALNIVPHHCEIRFEFRAIGKDDPDALVARNHRLCAQ